MSKLINNEGATKATFSILENLKEAEDLKIKKRVLAEGYGKTSVIEGEDYEDTSEDLDECDLKNKDDVPEGSDKPVKEEMTEEEKVCEGCGKKESECTCKKEGLYSGTKGQSVDEFLDKALDINKNLLANLKAGKTTATDPEGLIASVEKEIAEIEETIALRKQEGLREETVTEGENCEDDKIEERVCEGLEILNIKGNTVLLKESKGYIVGKNYDKETGLIESAEEYRTEKVANKAFKRLSSRK
jgi:hypothetical protein